MKKTLALAAVLSVLWTANTWAAATIGLNNYGAGAGAIYYQTAGTLAPMAGTFVELIGPSGAVTDSVSGATQIPMAEDGMFFGGTGVVPGVADSASAQFTLRAWRGAASYDAATERGEVSWSQATGSWNSAAVPPSPAVGPDLTNPALTIVAVPEPTTIALGLLGGAALLLFRRK